MCLLRTDRSGQGPQPAVLLFWVQVPAGCSGPEGGGIGETLRGGKEMGSGTRMGIERTGGMGGHNRAFLRSQGLGTESGAKMRQGAQGKWGMRVTGWLKFLCSRKL